jgi:hypothetical protein
MTIYKYLDAKPFRTKIVTDRKIRYSPMYALNDPFEGRPYYENLAPDEIVSSKLTSSYDRLPVDPMIVCGNSLLATLREKLGDMHPDIVADVESAFEEIMPTLDNPNRSREAFQKFITDDLIPLAKTMGPEIRRKIADKFNQELGILCLSEVRDSNLMWAHYADNSRGFVIGFDDTSTYFNSRSADDSMTEQLYQVTYSAKRPSTQNMIELAFQDILLTKPWEWKYEEERRHIRRLSGGDCVGYDLFGEPVVLFEFPASLVVEVIFGSRMELSKKSEMIKELKSLDYQHVEVFQARESETRYEILFDRIL